jgi:hypothetical protein
MAQFLQVPMKTGMDGNHWIGVRKEGNAKQDQQVSVRRAEPHELLIVGGLLIRAAIARQCFLPPS